jgi:hypothetical protein
MVGRVAELAMVAELYRASTDEGACCVATVIGQAGVGKSRLVREVVERIASDARVLRGRCLPYGEGITFWPLIEAVRGVAGIGADDPATVGMTKLLALAGDAEVAARVASAIGLSPQSFGVPEIFWAVRRLLEAGGHVDRVASYEPLPARRVAGHHLTRIDAGSIRELHPIGPLQPGIERRQRGAHFRRGPHRPQRIVLVEAWQAEDGHECVADDLLDRPAVAALHGRHGVEVLGHHLAQRFRIETLAEVRGALQVGKDDRDGASLLLCRQRSD